ncbi:gpW family head-tail joining protein [Spiribacter halobius]|uniref:Phage tail protein n=1 Tax=Sediminicurvatus halobius TaxID=2182432 RepID=A0A2U2MYI1_9GAMM|nr:gpW family head-tail joining protein [Spiribacter halobius]PWG61764.1 hypothetical protein DEM34_14965 [Spiribacter halobius]UEX76802.1 gpW family protein [Spiribacter halobius]
MSDLATLEKRLAEAESALHDLNIGKQVVQVSREGRSTQFANSPDQIRRLEAYIAELKSQIARLKGRGGRAPIQLWPA